MNVGMIGFPSNVDILPFPAVLIKPNLASFGTYVRVHVEVADCGLVDSWGGVNVPHGARAVPDSRTVLKGT